MRWFMICFAVVLSLAAGSVSAEESNEQAPDIGEASLSTNETGSLREESPRDKELLGLVESLRNNKKFEALLEDPDVREAVNAGDVEALTANPKFMEFLNSADVQGLEKK